MDVDERAAKGEGFKPYYITKIEELQLIVAEKSQNLRRLQAQRNELNAKGSLNFSIYNFFLDFLFKISIIILLLYCLICACLYIRKYTFSLKLYIKSQVGMFAFQCVCCEKNCNFFKNKVLMLERL